MPRVADRPFPTIGGHRPDVVEPWPVTLYIGVARQPVPAYTYDDYTAHYDEAAKVYDDVTAFGFDRFDLFCQFHGLTMSTGSPDDEGIFDSGRVELTLDNRDGSLSQYDANGRLVDWAPGDPLDIWATIGGVGWWLFSGRVTAWRERADGTVDVEAFDAFTQLNQEVAEWKPGHYADSVAARLIKILGVHGYTGARRFDTGDVTLHSMTTNATPLEEMQAVALSDGGILAVDADGTLVYRDRRWLVGRADQTVIPVLSDNYCAAPLVVWDLNMTTDDETMVNIATLENVADVTAEARNQASVDRHGPHTLPLPRRNDQWIAAGDGAELASYLVTRRAGHYLRVEEFALHLHDIRHDLWATGIDLRLGDVITFLHEQETTTGPDLIILDLIVQQISHEITPATWVTTIATTRAIGSRPINRYDRTAYDYDDGQPANVYAF